MKHLLCAALCTGLLATPILAEEKPGTHFEGEPSDSLAEAVANFSKYNQELADLLAKDELTRREIGEIHILTYSLENALEKIEEDVEEMAEVLEEVHLGSETSNVERVRSNGEIYLESARTLIP
ncbi:DUF6746 family protein [Halomonas rhizosphaerae]|uniref:DUF3347 domain-containing protein n=1 Tax=Halomonas rhizosphaerae TaxID=3043296 RepID=A0ABT6V0W1_9GAMM|nr:DUF6746 family protein [Halomonas rhizosphaerae]MDI5891123.1 hypothetical protein [Halomonas rhizosphaerae]MDI5919496.1 hypothetical protein [Halomonas rhizosphaerae]